MSRTVMPCISIMLGPLPNVLSILAVDLSEGVTKEVYYLSA